MSMLENIGKGITKAGSHLSQKAHDLGELSRLNGEVAIRENHRRECIRILGERYYDALRQGDVPEQSVLYEEIRSLDQELEMLKKKIQRLRKNFICQNCGACIPSHGSFCPACGIRIIKENTCPVCGTAMDEDARFCVNCGNRTVDLFSRGE